jgi:drug/metabolite transporter (DMT)-like permease
MLIRDKVMISDRKWGYVSVLAATVLYGIWNTFSKILLQDLDPLALSALVYCIAGIFLFSVRYSGINNRLMGMLDSKFEAETFMTRKDYLILLITATAGSVIAPFIYLSGLNEITAVNASLLMNAEVFFIIIIGIFFLNERFQKKEVVGLILLLIGTIFLAINGEIRNFSVTQSFGTLLVIIAAFFWSIDTTLSKFLSNKRDLLGLSALKCSIGGLVLLTISLLLGLNLTVPINHLPYLLFIGLVSIGFSFVMIYYAIRKIGSTRTGSIFPFSSLFGAIFAFLILNEPFTFQQLLFGLLMILGVYIIYKYQIK